MGFLNIKISSVFRSFGFDVYRTIYALETNSDGAQKFSWKFKIKVADMSFKGIRKRIQIYATKERLHQHSSVEAADISFEEKAKMECRKQRMTCALEQKFHFVVSVY